MARRSYTVGWPDAKVTSDQEEAVRAVAEGLPVVLIGSDPTGLGELLRRAPDRQARERLLGVMVGEPEASATEASATEASAVEIPAVEEAAAEMAAEMWPWAATRPPSEPAGPAGPGPESR